MKLNLSLTTKHKIVLILTPVVTSLAYTVAKMNPDQIEKPSTWAAAAIATALQAGAMAWISVETADKFAPIPAPVDAQPVQPAPGTVPPKTPAA